MHQMQYETTPIRTLTDTLSVHEITKVIDEQGVHLKLHSLDLKVIIDIKRDFSF